MGDETLDLMRETRILLVDRDDQVITVDLCADQESPGFEEWSRAHLLAWAQISATRENTAQFERLANAIEKMAAAGADQAAAVREQTDRMQQNIDDAQANVPDVMEILTKQVPEIMRKLQVGGGALNLESLFGSKTTVERSEGSA